MDDIIRPPRRDWAEKAPSTVACLALGVEEEASDYLQQIETLKLNRCDVVTYPCSIDVLRKGNPDLLKRHVDFVRSDFNRIATGYDQRLHVGASIGALMAWLLHIE